MTSFESLSNDEVSARLRELGVPGAAVTANTRGVYIRKLQKLTGRELSESVSYQSPSSKPPDTPKSKLKTGSTPSDGYYGIRGLCKQSPAAAQSPIYQSKEDVDRILKSNPGARFKWFRNQEGAEMFSKSEPPDPPSTASVSASKEKEANPLPSYKYKTVEKNQLKAAIEKGDIDAFRDMVWQNPTILVDTAGEIPEICHVSSRRNALHVAADVGNIDICRELLTLLQNDQFWTMIFPKDEAESREEKKCRLIDLYLNNQDGGRQSKVRVTIISAVAVTSYCVTIISHSIPHYIWRVRKDMKMW